MATKTAKRGGRLQWRRPSKRTLKAGTQARTWRSRCGRYIVEEHSHPLLPRIYLVLRFTRLLASDAGEPAQPEVGVGQTLFAANGYWNLLGHHRTRSAAMRRCEQDLRGKVHTEARRHREE